MRPRRGGRSPGGVGERICVPTESEQPPPVDRSPPYFIMPWRYLCLFALLPLAAWAAAPDSDIECSGVLVVPGKVSVHLSSRAAGASAWLALGETFAGYTIASYDAPQETVVLTRDGVTLKLRLQTPKTKAGDPMDQADPAEMERIARALLNNLRQLAAAADQYYLEHGTNHATLEDLVGPTKYVKEVNPVDGEDYKQLEFEQGKPIRLTTPSGITADANGTTIVPKGP